MSGEFSPDTLASIEARLVNLQGKLVGRRGNPAYRTNIPAIEAEISRLGEIRAMIVEARAVAS